MSTQKFWIYKLWKCFVNQPCPVRNPFTRIIWFPPNLWVYLMLILQSSGINLMLCLISRTSFQHLSCYLQDHCLRSVRVFGNIKDRCYAPMNGLVASILARCSANPLTPTWPSTSTQGLSHCTRKAKKGTYCNPKSGFSLFYRTICDIVNTWTQVTWTGLGTMWFLVLLKAGFESIWIYMFFVELNDSVSVCNAISDIII